MTKVPLYTIGLALFMAASSCKREDSSHCGVAPVQAADTTSVVGTWELNMSVNGFTGKSEYHLPCNGDRFIFTDSTFERYVDNRLLRSGSYVIFPDTFYIHRTRQMRIVFDQDSALRQSLSVDSRYMVLGLDANDAPAAQYVRIGL